MCGWGWWGWDRGLGNALTNAVIYPQFDGEQIHYENEVRALWTDLPLGRISRDSELRCVWKSL